MADAVTGGLDSAEDPVIKETRPKTGGLNIAGTKGVSLEPENSMEVRNRLLELIKQREAERSGFGALLENLAVAGQAPGTSFQSRLEAQNKVNRERNQDIFNMRLGVSQLDTEEKRLAQARAEALQNREQFGSLLTGGANAPTAPAAGGEGGGGPIASPQQVASFAQNLNKDQAAALMMLYRQNPAEATKQLIQLTKLTDSQREAREAGLTPGSPDYQAFMRLKLAGSGAFVPHKISTEEGDIDRTPIEAARTSGALSATPGPAPTTTPPIAPAEGPLPGPAPTIAPVAGPSPAPAAGPLPGPAPAVRPTTGALPGPAPAAVATPPVVPAPPTSTAVNTRPGGFAPSSTQALDLRKKQEEAKIAAQQEQIKSDIELEKQRKLVPIEGRKKESEDLGKASAAEQTALTETVSRNRDNDIYAKRIVSTVNNIPKEVQKDVFGILNHSDFKSAMLNFISQGVQTPIGSLSLPALADIATQLSPSVRRQQKADGTNPVLEASQQIKSDVARLTLAFTQAANKGQGAVSDSERQIYMKAVADPARSSADMIKLMAISVQLAASHSAQTQGAWDNAQKAGLSWPDFKRSDKYKEMIANQIRESEEKLIPTRRR